MEVKIMLKIKDVVVELTEEEIDDLFETLKRIKGGGRTEFPIIYPYPSYPSTPWITITN